jgi:Na+-transporting methylmalonyl-CoA/oxaloacetate decarboxylase beta subunit
MVKKIILITAIIAGAFMLLSCVAPMLIGAILEIQMQSQVAGTVGIIGGADGPTAVMITGVTRVGSAVTKIVVGALLIVAGIWGLRKSKE